ncbi:MAG: hypothetical protein ACI9G1_000592 [Pirellulaceae bacterium]|jgi:hypothetical protein
MHLSFRFARAFLNFACAIACVWGSSANVFAADNYLLLDSRWVEHVKGAELIVGAATKHPSNPLMVEDQGWEPRWDDMHPSLVNDQTGSWKLWYNPFIYDRPYRHPDVKPNSLIAWPPRFRYPAATRPRHTGLCFAESTDGLNWERPNLNLYDFKGSTSNNIIARDLLGTHVSYDEHDKDPLRRYKLLAGRSQNNWLTLPDGRVTAGFSPDGVHWSWLDVQKFSVPNDSTLFPAGQLHWIWDQTSLQYIAYLLGEQDADRYATRMTSPDFLRWSPLQKVNIDPPMSLHKIVPFRYGSTWLAIVHGQHAALDFPLQSPFWAASTKNGVVWPELAYSKDGLNWQRLGNGRAIIPLGVEQSIDDRVILCANPIVANDRIRLYYCGSDDRLRDWRHGHWCLAELGLHRWAGWQAKTNMAKLTTSTVPWTGQIHVTADIAQHGRIEVIVESIDESGVIKQVNRTEIRDTCTDLPLPKTSPESPGQSVRLRFILNQSTIYAFGCTPSSE